MAVRTRPTASFAQDNLIVDTERNVRDEWRLALRSVAMAQPWHLWVLSRRSTHANLSFDCAHVA